MIQFQAPRQAAIYELRDKPESRGSVMVHVELKGLLV